METRERIENALADLHRERGLAALRGAKFDNARIVELHERLATLADATEVQAQLDREAAGEKHDAEVNAVRTEKADASAARIKARQEAETKLREFVAAMKLELLYATTERKARSKLNTLTGEKQPIENENEHRRTLSLLIGSQLRTITNHPSRLGILTFPSTMPNPDKSWA